MKKVWTVENKRWLPHRAYGQFVFRENKERSRGYRNQHLRKTKRKRARKLKRNEAVKNDAAEPQILA